MAAPRSEIADLIARYCAQLGEMGIRVEQALLFGSYEDNIRRQLETKLRQCLTALTELRRMETRSGTQQAVVATASATGLKFIPDNSVDYVFTDPPFGGNIFYSDASMLYEAWLGEVTNGHRSRT
jgi:adenine-specific DNA methylase